MYWLNVIVTLLLLLGLVGLLALTAADLFGLLRSGRWRSGMGQPAAMITAAAEATLPPPPPAEPDEAPLAWILYTRNGTVEHTQPLSDGKAIFVGRQAFPGLDRSVALRAAEVAWRDGRPAVRSLDPTSPLWLRLPDEPEAVPVEAGAGWEAWEADAELELGGYRLRWREDEE
ncbi:MAG: hypothetical protein GX774_16370 [Armatimonadetes bacterium]|nr:hypothetical protein [Armatimonadota bacterium]